MPLPFVTLRKSGQARRQPWHAATALGALLAAAAISAACTSSSAKQVQSSPTPSAEAGGKHGASDTGATSGAGSNAKVGGETSAAGSGDSRSASSASPSASDSDVVMPASARPIATPSNPADSGSSLPPSGGDIDVSLNPSGAQPAQPAQPSQPVIDVSLPVQPAQPAQPTQPTGGPGVPTNPTAVAQPAQPAQPARPAAKGSMLIPVTPFSNMASGYQATNPGFRAILKDSSGKLLAAGPVSIDSVVNGYTDDASSGSAYGRLVLDISLVYIDASVETGELQGRHDGKLSICMAQDANAAYDASTCKNLSGNIHPERPFQWLDKSCGYEVADRQVKIVSFSGDTGEGGTRSQIALAVYHPAYGFAAPGKAFKDYQSPLVLDMDGNGQVDLTDVWNDEIRVAFDLEGKGKSTRTGWVAPQDGLLAMDLDGDGLISSGRELFGEWSAPSAPSAKTAGDKPWQNGFAALASHDSNHDGRIDAQDKNFDRLLVWRDQNQDGVSAANELSPLAKAGIASISLAYTKTGSAAKPLTVMDNEVRIAATFKTTDGKERLVADVWFKQRREANAVAAAAAGR